MKKIALLLVLILTGFCRAAHITDIDELYNAAASGGTHTIAPGTYTLNSFGGNLLFETDITLTHDGTDGNVVITANNNYETVIRNCTSTFSGQSNSKRIIFTQGSGDTVRVESTSSAVNVIFNYCDFTDSNAVNGLTIQNNPAAEITVTCNKCIIEGNAADGASLSSGNVNFVEILNLNDCDVNSNGSASNDQGATAHENNQYLNISGGRFYNNAGPGIAVVDGSKLYVTGAEFYGNYTVGTGGANIQCESTVFVFIENCNFHSANSNSHIKQTRHGTNVVSNCYFHDDIGNGANSIFTSGGRLIVEGCIFDTVAQGDNLYAICSVSSYPGTDFLYIKNNTFYNVTQVLRVPFRLFSFCNNIIHTVTDFAIYTNIPNAYKLGKDNGYNYFYNCAHNFYDITNGYADQSQPSDVLDVDPQFVDAANGDFRLAPNSPCLNAGKPTLLSGYTDIGAWQRKSMLLSDYTPAGDLNEDRIVDFYDFATMASNWLVDCLDDPNDPACGLE